MELRGWWLNRMAKGPRPFQEKMVLFWHGHFATSFEKVRNAYYMWRQNELFRRLATGNWLELLTLAGKDPAMLIWLDQAQSRKEHPNENFAREVMELFSLGEGHYAEQDVTEGARALTGWSLDRPTRNIVYRPVFHDNGDKTFLGRTGNLNGDDVMAQIVAQPQAARFITAKLWNYFAGQPPPDAERRARRRSSRERKQFQAVAARHVPQRGVLRRRHHSQPGQKPGAMAGRQRADARMRSAADVSARPAAQSRTGSVRAAERQGLGRRHHLDHHQHAAGPLQRRGDARAGHDSAAGRIRFRAQTGRAGRRQS